MNQDGQTECIFAGYCRGLPVLLKKSSMETVCAYIHISQSWHNVNHDSPLFRRILKIAAIQHMELSADEQTFQ